MSQLRSSDGLIWKAREVCLIVGLVGADPNPVLFAFLLRPVALLGTQKGMQIERMVGTSGFEPLTSTVSKSKYSVIQ